MARRRPGRYALSLYGLLFFVFLYAPIVLIVIYSFNANPVNMMIWDGFTFDWYRAIFGQSTKISESALYVESTSQLYAAVRTSLVAALIASTISTIFGTCIAIAVSRFRFRIRGLYRALMYMPMMMPDIVLGISLLIFFVSAGISLSTR